MRAPPWAPECKQTGNCDCDEPLKVAPHSPDAFPALFVTRSLPQHTPRMYVYFTILDIRSWSCVGLTL